MTSLFYFLPQACLAAIIITAVYKLIDLATFRRMWSYDRADGIAWLATFLIVLSLGVSKGIIFGALIALGLHLWRTSHPHIAWEIQNIFVTYCAIPSQRRPRS